MSFILGDEILIINGVQQNGFDSYFGGFKHLAFYSLIVCCSLEQF